jgi:hypothetical protein
VRKGEEWALAAFSGWMQLGDTHAMLGRMDESIACYGKGFQIQMAALGDRDPRVAETCRYLPTFAVSRSRSHSSTLLPTSPSKADFFSLSFAAFIFSRCCGSRQKQMTLRSPKQKSTEKKN